MSTTDLELDDEAKALAEAINATPDDNDAIDTQTESNKPAKKGMSKGIKFMLGGASLLLLAMGGAYVAMEMGVGQPVQKAQPKQVMPPLLDEKPMQSSGAPQPVVETPSTTAAMQAGNVLPPAQNAPVDIAPPAADPFKAAVPAVAPQDDPFKAAAPVAATVNVPTPAVVSTPVEAPVTVVKEKKVKQAVDKVDTEVKPVKIHKKSTVKKHKEVPEDNGYVRII